MKAQHAPANSRSFAPGLPGIGRPIASPAPAGQDRLRVTRIERECADARRRAGNRFPASARVLSDFEEPVAHGVRDVSECWMPNGTNSRRACQLLIVDQ